MTDVTVTAANVIPAATAALAEGTAGAAITAGDVLYKDAAAANVLKLAQHDDTEAEAEAVGIAVNDAAIGQPVKYCTKGQLAFGAVLLAGVTYCVSGTAGGIAPDADVGSSDFKTILGVAISTSVLAVNIQISGAELA